jgi:hypothetical protein
MAMNAVDAHASARQFRRHSQYGPKRRKKILTLARQPIAMPLFRASPVRAHTKAHAAPAPRNQPRLNSSNADIEAAEAAKIAITSTERCCSMARRNAAKVIAIASAIAAQSAYAAPRIGNQPNGAITAIVCGGLRLREPSLVVVVCDQYTSWPCRKATDDAYSTPRSP